MKKKIIYALGVLTTSALLILAPVAKSSAQSNKLYKSLSAADKMLADTLIKAALENEGLYTIAGKLKTISSVTNLNLKIANGDKTSSGKKEVTDTSSADFQKLKTYQKVIKALDFGDFKFMISPYKMYSENQRSIQVTVHRSTLLDSLVKANQQFYGQFGFTPGVDAELLINTTEYEDKLNRFRSYGYLFGYPEHAVSFFLEGAKYEEQNKGQLLKRDFFQIPVYSGKNGHFVYAVPKDYKTTEVDSAIYNRAVYTLERFKKIRPKYIRKDGTVKYYDLLLKMIRLDD